MTTILRHPVYKHGVSLHPPSYVAYTLLPHIYCSAVHSPFGRVYRRRSFPGSTKRASFLLPAGRDTLMPSAREQSTNYHENLANFQSPRKRDLSLAKAQVLCLPLFHRYENCHDLDEFATGC